jgi:hypothetical protein
MYTDCSCPLWLVFLMFCRGLDNFRGGSTPLGLKATHHLFDRIPNWHSKIPKTTPSTSQASSSRAQSSRPTIEQREIIF